MLLAGVVTPEEAYGAVRWDVIFLLAGLIPLGIALEKSGAAALIASLVSSLTEGLPVLLVVMGFYVFTTLLTEVLSNNATVILLVPIAINLAVHKGLDPRILVLAVMFAASTSFLTPIGYQTNTWSTHRRLQIHRFLQVGVLLTHPARHPHAHIPPQDVRLKISFTNIQGLASMDILFTSGLHGSTQGLVPWLYMRTRSSLRR
jgi:di/tricarboxylate transporter